MAMQMTRPTPISVVVARYLKRRGLSQSELARRIDRDVRAVRAVLTGEQLGLRPHAGGPGITYLIARELEIPDRELYRAITATQRERFLGYAANEDTPGWVKPRVSAGQEPRLARSLAAA